MVNRRNLGIHDSEFKAKDELFERMAENRHNTNKWIAQETRDERFVDEVTDVDRQLGKTMERGVFKKLVEGLTTRLSVDYHPRYPTMAVNEIKWTVRGLQKVYKMSVGSLEAPIIPEWSLLTRKKTVDAKGNPIMIPENVLAHGWRRGLVMLVQEGFISRSQAERIIDEYGSGNRPSWQVLMGYKAPEGREFVY